MSTWPAPAKINLFLHILGRRDDGYHQLQTAFQFLDFCDHIHIEINQSGKIALKTSYTGVTPDDDLVMRAARLLLSHTKDSAGAAIYVEKQLPMGGGIGGGSSDAATTLVALNHLWNLNIDTRSLQAMGLSLGADVPVFIHGHAAWAEGLGEDLEPVEPPERWFLVANPGIHISTAEVFNAPDLTRDTPAIKIRDFLAGMGHNDCEKVVRKWYPEVSQLIDWMGKKAPAMMTGTGACVFSGYETEEGARQVLSELPQAWHGFVAKGVNKSPLLSRLAEKDP